MQSQNNAPHVLDYLDACLYLQTYYQYRKSLRRGFSYEIWASELQFKSRSFLRMMTLGKRKITSSLVQKICEHNFFVEDERDYFQHLVRFNQSSNPREKRLFSQKMMDILKRQNHSTMIENPVDFIASPLLPRALSLFNYEDVEMNLSNIARILKLSQSRALEVLQKLEKLSLIQASDSNPQVCVWTSAVHSFKIQDKVGNAGLMQFHRLSLIDSIQALESPPETRRYKSLLLPMSESEYSEFNRMLDDFSSEQVVRHKSTVGALKKIYQVNFNVHPVTEILNIEAKQVIE